MPAYPSVVFSRLKRIPRKKFSRPLDYLMMTRPERYRSVTWSELPKSWGRTSLTRSFRWVLTLHHACASACLIWMYWIIYAQSLIHSLVWKQFSHCCDVLSASLGDDWRSRSGRRWRSEPAGVSAYHEKNMFVLNGWNMTLRKEGKIVSVVF